jgi:membrane protein insertase Oxa1/YidC/SpoIIIJ
VELGADSGVAMTGGIKWFFRALSVGMFALTFNMPTAVFMYWNLSNVFSLISSQMLKRDSVRRALNMPLASEVREAVAKANAIKGEQPSTFANLSSLMSKAREEQQQKQEQFLDQRPKYASKAEKAAEKPSKQ